MGLSRLLLLNCRSPFLDDAKIYPPLANLYLKACVEAAVADVDVVVGDDDYDLSDLSFVEDFDAVGISIMTPQRQEATQLARAIKRAWPAKTVIAGGPHVRHYLKDVAAERAFDYLVPADGERPLTAIVQGQASQRSLHDTLTRDELASQPRPDRSSANARDILRRYHYSLGGRPATTMMTARGCPEQCTFCEDAMTTTRPASLTGLCGELDDIRAAGYSAVYIFDDVFALSVTRIRPICDELLRRDLWYRCNAQARHFTRNGDEMARVLADTGCVEIAFGAESGSQRILDNVRKRCTVAQNYATVAYAKKAGLKVKAFILLGLPGETAETLAETEHFISTAGLDDFQCAIYMPYCGTQIRRDIDNGTGVDLQILARGYDGEVTGAYGIRGGNTSCEVRTAALSADDLQQFRDYLVTTYKPKSHTAKWSADHFFDTHLAGRAAEAPDERRVGQLA